MQDQESEPLPVTGLRWQRWAFGAAAAAILLGGYAIGLQRFSAHVDENVRGTLRTAPAIDDAATR